MTEDLKDVMYKGMQFLSGFLDSDMGRMGMIEIQTDTRYGHACAKTGLMIRCPHCTQYIFDDSDFCPRCGNALEDEEDGD